MTMNTFLVSYFGMIVLHITYPDLLENMAMIVIYLQALLGPVFLMLTRCFFAFIERVLTTMVFSKTVRRGYMEFYGTSPASRRQGVGYMNAIASSMMLITLSSSEIICAFELEYKNEVNELEMLNII